MGDELPVELIDRVVEENLGDEVSEQKLEEIKKEVSRRMRGEETEDKSDPESTGGLLSRRRFLKLAGLGAG